jgi:hypothetical protein
MTFDFDKFQKAVIHADKLGQGNGVNTGEIQEFYLDSKTGSITSTSSVNSFEVLSPVLKRDSFGTDDFREIRLILPPKQVALRLIFTTWDKACVLFRFYHRPSLLEEVDLIYSLDSAKFGDRQQKFLPFLYSILACGSLFSKSSGINKAENDNLEDDGFRYFLEARKLIDIPNVADIASIQTIVMMIMYLQCSARLSTCYSYIGIALRSALKEGLHRNLSIFQNSRRRLDPIEIDTRKRLFYTIYKMDIYINSLLGLPRSINEDEFDQEFPEELDDENITRTEYRYDQQQGRLSSSGCANHHTKLMLVLSHIIKKLYPIKVKKTTKKESVTPDNIHNKVTELELELKNWLDKLPIELKPTDPSQAGVAPEIPEKFVLANYYMHLAFLNCQIMLYRPFIHFVSNGNMTTADPRSLIRGRNCIKVARMVVKLANKMIDQNLLVGTYWFSMYTIFFSIACLIYYFHFASNNPNTPSNSSLGANYAGVLFDDDLNIDMIKKDIDIGKKVLDCLKNNSNSSLRIYNILNTLFEQLNRRTANTTRARNSGFGNHVPTHMPNLSFENSPPQEAISNIEASAQVTPMEHNPTIQIGEFDLNPSSQPVESMPLNPDSSPDDPGFKNQYIPGVFDKLDAQIFGKILPPYMLEKNYQIHQQSQISSPNTEPVDGSMPQLPQMTPGTLNIDENTLQQSHLDNIKMEDYDLLAYGDQDLNFLDPFSSAMDSFNSNPM